MGFVRNLKQGFEAGRSARTGNAVVRFDSNRAARGGGVVPFNNDPRRAPARGRPPDVNVAALFREIAQQRPVEPYWPPRTHRNIYGPSVRIEVEETRYGKKTTYFFEDGYFDESWEA